MLLQPPFNEEARAQAGFGPQWYMPLAMPSKNAATAANVEREVSKMLLHQGSMEPGEAIKCVFS